MPRPARPLLNRDQVIAAAVRIIDTEGLAACSLPRLAREFAVSAPSLYHHFADRAEINAEVARYIVRQTPVPRKEEPQRWVEWFVKLALNFRRTILRHPTAAPLLLEHVPREVLSTLYNDASQYLTEVGIPNSVHVLILDGLENLTLGTALMHAMKPQANRSKIFPHIDAASEPALAAAVTANEWNSTDELFAETVRGFLTGATAGVRTVADGKRAARPRR